MNTSSRHKQRRTVKKLSHIFRHVKIVLFWHERKRKRTVWTLLGQKLSESDKNILDAHRSRNSHSIFSPRNIEFDELSFPWLTKFKTHMTVPWHNSNLISFPIVFILFRPFFSHLFVCSNKCLFVYVQFFIPTFSTVTISTLLEKREN